MNVGIELTHQGFGGPMVSASRTDFALYLGRTVRRRQQR
jgi:hypothetical protein